LAPFVYLHRCISADLNIGDLGCAGAHSYSHSRGMYAGVSLDGSIVFSRPDVNHRFYGRVVTPHDLLKGYVPPPRAARPLYDALEQVGQPSKPSSPPDPPSLLPSSSPILQLSY
jgi:lipid-binding SYLF domain-containing protein